MNSNIKDNVLVTALTVVQRNPRKTVTFSSSFVSNGMPWMLNRHQQYSMNILNPWIDRHTPGEVRVKENIRHEFTIIFFDVSLFHNVLCCYYEFPFPYPILVQTMKCTNTFTNKQGFCLSHEVHYKHKHNNA